MMKVTMYGSHLCPDTLYAINELAARKVKIEFKNLSGSMADLKAFLPLREGNPMFDESRANGSIGIPYFIMEDGFTTLELDDVLARL